MKTFTPGYTYQKIRRIVLGMGLAFFSLIIIFLIAAKIALAGSEEIYTVPEEALNDGGLFFITGTKGRYVPAPLLKTDVVMDISGPIAKVRVTQSFTNTSAVWVEGVYTFPLPENSAVDRLNMIIGERTVKGVIQEKDQARKTYEKAKAAGQRVSLVSQERPNIFSNEVANIGPGETIVVEIEYQDQARFLDGEFEIRFPMVVRPRYIPGNRLPVSPEGSGWSYDSDQVPDASRITPIISHPAKGSINPVSISVSLDPGFSVQNIKSPSHNIRIRERSNSYEINLRNGQVPADSDFVLQWNPVPGATPVAGIFSEKVDGEYYYLFMVIPRKNEAGMERKILPREVIFIIDVSGSMSGEAIRQAQAALLKGLDGLKSGDRFNIITFNSSAYDVFKGAIPANQRNLEEARNFVSRLQANGGTEMASALTIALNGETGMDHLRQVIFMTDGAVGNEEALFQIIHKGLGDSRLFTVGIGSSPNSHFMRNAAEMGKGTFTYIARLDELDEKMKELFHKLETPVLKDISFQLPEGLDAEIFPKNIPDLYDGEPVLITLKTKTKLKKKITLKGEIVGIRWVEKINPSKKSKNKGTAALWAREKIRDITKQAIKGGTSRSPETREEIVKVALTHNMISKYTSLVAVDDEIARKGTDLVTTPVPTNLPKGMDPAMVAGKQTPAAQTTPPTVSFRNGSLDLDDSDAELLVVTGSRIARSTVTPPQPLAVIGNKSVDVKGVENLAETFNEIPVGDAPDSKTTSPGFPFNSNGQFEGDDLLNDLPQTATGLWQKILLGLFSLFSAVVFMLFARKKAIRWRAA